MTNNVSYSVLFTDPNLFMTEIALCVDSPKTAKCLTQVLTRNGYTVTVVKTTSSTTGPTPGAVVGGDIASQDTLLTSP